MRSAFAAIPARIFGLKHRKARCTVAVREKAMRALRFSQHADLFDRADTTELATARRIGRLIK
jgi:hypothetical protein